MGPLCLNNWLDEGYVIDPSILVFFCRFVSNSELDGWSAKSSFSVLVVVAVDFGDVVVVAVGLGFIGVAGTCGFAGGDGNAHCGIGAGYIVGDGRCGRQIFSCQLFWFLTILSFVALVSGQSLVGCAESSPWRRQ
jgi:hypothetical protein